MRHPCTCGQETGNYLLILMDCNMPIMDGFQSTKAIREFCDTHQINQPLISALTAYTNEQFEERSA